MVTKFIYKNSKNSYLPFPPFWTFCRVSFLGPPVVFTLEDCAFLRSSLAFLKAASRALFLCSGFIDLFFVIISMEAPTIARVTLLFASSLAFSIFSKSLLVDLSENHSPWHFSWVFLIPEMFFYFLIDDPILLGVILDDLLTVSRMDSEATEITSLYFHGNAERKKKAPC